MSLLYFGTHIDQKRLEEIQCQNSKQKSWKHTEGYVEVEAEDEDAAYQDIDDKINEGWRLIFLVMEKIISMTWNCLCRKLKKRMNDWRKL